MGWIDWRILAVLAACAVVVLLIGLRGRRVDALPRCRRRRCRYELTSFLGASRPGAGYPVTCPECGRVARGEREVKWGRRVARRGMVALSAALLLLAAAPVGVAMYSRATNANPLAWAPMWYLIHGVERDTYTNGFAHQKELLRRADADEIGDAAAKRLTKRILEWQRDDAIYWGTLGDVFASLTLNGKTTPEDVKKFWAHIWRFEVVGRPEIAIGEAPNVEIHGLYRGHGFHRLILRVPEGNDVWLPSHYDMGFRVGPEIVLQHEGGDIRIELHDQGWLSRGGRIDAAGLRTVWIPMSRSKETWESARTLDTPYTVRVDGTASVRSAHDPGTRFATEAEIEAIELRTSWPVSGEFEVTPVKSEDAAVELIDSPSLRATLSQNATAIVRMLRGQPFSLEIMVGPGQTGPAWLESRTPIDPAVSFEIFVDLPGEPSPRRAGRFLSRTMPAVHSAHQLFWFERFWMTNPANPGRVILRPDPTSAARTPDVTRILDAVIEIPIVIDHVPPGGPFPRPGQMSAPATPQPNAAPANAPTP